MSDTRPGAVDVAGPPGLARPVLQQGKRYQLARSSAEDSFVRIQCSNVAQRNWSRVAIGLSQHQHSTGQQQLFLKQYVDRAGQWHESLWSYERSGTRVAHAVLSKFVGIPRLIASDSSHLVNAFEYVDIVSMDGLLRQDATAFESAYPAAMECMTEVLAVLLHTGSDGRIQLPRKRRDYGDGEIAVNFKGFEIRNLGLRAGTRADPSHSDFFLFDFGRPYLAPIQEAAAKLFVSIGLLNWGRPLIRFTQGPDFKLLESARQALAPYLDVKAVQAELRLQRSFRWAEIQGVGKLERMVKQLGISTLGHRYFDRLEQWCRGALK